MEIYKIKYKFKYKLSVLLFSAVIIASTFLGICQYMFMRNTLYSNFEKQKSLVRDRVVNILSSADNVQFTIENQLAKDAKLLLEKVNKTYIEEGNIKFDLNSFISGRKGIDLYIIDSNNTVIYTTDKGDEGLNFRKWPEFLEYLNRIRTEKGFFSSRVSLSINESKIKKYCYLLSDDGKYIFEISYDMDEVNQSLKGVGFDNFEETIVKDNKFIDSIILFDYEGESYKKYNGSNVNVDFKYMEFFKEAMSSMKVVETIGEYNGRKAYYQYVPYEIIDAQGINERNVVQIIYNGLELQEDLNGSKGIIISVVLLATVVSASYGFIKAKKMIVPIEKISEGINEISIGKFDIKIDVNTKDEIQVLGHNLEKMAKNIMNLLEEQYKDKENLKKQNLEISAQKEEINALYEETTAMNEELTTLLKENENSYFETVRALANAIEAKDSYTGGHCERVMKYSLAIAEELGLSDYEKNRLRFGSILHDIGKIGIPESILNYCGRFSDEDYEVIKKHPEIGGNILKELSFLDESRRIVYEHHERVDGKGYPKGLKSDEIDFLSKIVCIADAYDAMTSSRPYRKEVMSKEKAIEELAKNAGTQFDKSAVEAFLNYLRRDSSK